MSEITELSQAVTGAVDELRKGNANLLAGAAQFAAHEKDPAAHQIEEPGSPFRTAIETLVSNTLLESDMNDAMQKIIASRVASAITTSLPDAIAQELKNPLSNLSTLVSDRINEDVNKKIQNGELGDAVSSVISDAKSTADLAKSTADKNSKTITSLSSTLDAVQSTANNALPKTGTAASATKLATARSLQVDLESTSAASFDGTANKDIGVKGNLPVERGGTGANSAEAACDKLGAVQKSGARGALAGSETASVVTGSQSINANSPDSMSITTTGTVALTFTAAAANVMAVKILCLTASAATALSISGAEWQNNGTAPNWGSAGKRLILIAVFVAGRVILSVCDNTE